MLCPHCHDPLKISDRMGVEIDYCPSCRGVWLDRGELDKLIERALEAEQTKQYSRPEPPPRRYDRDERDYYDDKKKYKKKKKKKYKSLLEDIFDFD